MKTKLNKNYKITLILLGILLVAAITLGVSYALWQITNKQTDKNIISSGCLEITFEETSNSINLTNTYPITDEEGMKLVPYKFKIKNTCTIDSKYYVTLNSFGDTATAMNDSVIKYAFNLSSKSLVNFDREFLTNAPINVETASLEITDLIESYILKEDYLRVDEEKEYSLYLWIDYNANNEVMGQTFKANLSIINVATDKAPLLANLKATSNIAATGKFLEGPLVKNTIEKLEFVSSNIVPDDAIGSWDVSEQQNGAVMAWYYDTDKNGKYEVYIGQEDGVIANRNSSNLFQNLTLLSALDIANLNTSNVTNMQSMFQSCSNLTELNLNNFDTSKVITMSHMFYLCSKLTNLNVNSFDTSNVISMGNMFNGCTNLINLNLSNFDTSNVSLMFYMFSNCISLESLDISNFDTSNVTEMSFMFSNCSSLKSLDLSNFDTSNVTEMWGMFEYCGLLTNLNVSSFNTSKVTTMQAMFQKCYNLKSLDIGNFDTSNVTDMSWMFYDCLFLNTINFTNATFKNVNSMQDMFNGVPSDATIRVKDINAQDFIESINEFDGEIVIG